MNPNDPDVPNPEEQPADPNAQQPGEKPKPNPGNLKKGQQSHTGGPDGTDAIIIADGGGLVDAGVASASLGAEVVSGAADAAGGALEAAGSALEGAGSALEAAGGCLEGCGSCSLAMLLMLSAAA